MTQLIVGAVLGFLLANLQQWWDRRRHLHAYWRALREEIQYCHEGALGMESARQLGQLPTTVFDEVFKDIIAEDEIATTQIHDVLRYYDLVRQTNTSLDIVAAATERGDQFAAYEEARRVTAKREKFRVTHPDKCYAAAIAIADEHCNTPWWKRDADKVAQAVTWCKEKLPWISERSP